MKKLKLLLFILSAKFLDATEDLQLFERLNKELHEESIAVYNVTSQNKNRLAFYELVKKFNLTNRLFRHYISKENDAVLVVEINGEYIKLLFELFLYKEPNFIIEQMWDKKTLDPKNKVKYLLFVYINFHTASYFPKILLFNIQMDPKNNKNVVGFRKINQFLLSNSTIYNQDICEEIKKTPCTQLLNKISFKCVCSENKLDLSKTVNFPLLEAMYLEQTSFQEYTNDNKIVHNNVAFLTLNSCSITNKELHMFLTAFPNLKCFEALRNKISEINLKPESKIEKIDLGYNSIEIFVCSEKMQKLFLYNNKLQNLDISAAKELIVLDVQNNNLTKLNLSANIRLKSLLINNNQINRLDIRNLNKLNFLHINNNPLQHISIKDINELINLKVEKKNFELMYMPIQLKILSVQNIDYNVILNIPINSQIQDINLTGIKNSNDHRNSLIEIVKECVPYNQLQKLKNTRKINIFKTIELSELTTIRLENLYYSSAYLESCLKLSKVTIINNMLVDIKFSPEVVELDLDKNFLTLPFKVPENSKLEKLIVKNNNLSILDVRNARSLVELKGSCNYCITSLDLSNNLNLVHVDMINNSLTSIILKGPILIKYLFLTRNKLKILDVSSLSNLKELDISYNEIAKLSLPQKSNIEIFRGENNNLEPSIKDILSCLPEARQINLSGNRIDLNKDLAKLILYELKTINEMILYPCLFYLCLNYTSNEKSILDKFKEDKKNEDIFLEFMTNKEDKPLISFSKECEKIQPHGRFINFQQNKKEFVLN